MKGVQKLRESMQRTDKYLRFPGFHRSERAVVWERAASKRLLLIKRNEATPPEIHYVIATKLSKKTPLTEVQ